MVIINNKTLTKAEQKLFDKYQSATQQLEHARADLSAAETAEETAAAKKVLSLCEGFWCAAYKKFWVDCFQPN